MFVDCGKIAAGALVILLALGLAACSDGYSSGGSGDGYSSSSSSSSSGGSGALAQLQANIFSPICSECHIGAGAPEGLRLDSEQNSYDHLVNVESNGSPGNIRVIPGNADDSYIVRKVEGGPDIVGGRMPLDRPALSSTQINMIRDWITNGAPREGDGMTATRLSFESAYETGSSVEFTLRFSRPVQAESIHSGAFQVYLMNESIRWFVQESAYELLDKGQTLMIVMDSPGVPVTALEVIVNDPAFSAVLDIKGRLIDGDSDGMEGGVYRHVYRF